MNLRTIDYCVGCLLPVLLMMASPLRAEQSTTGLTGDLPGLLQMLQERQQLNDEMMRRFDDPKATVTKTPALSAKTEAPVHNAFRDGLRDPFTVTPEMIGKTKPQDNDVLAFQPVRGAMRLPALKLRGVITRTKGSEPLALLEIGGHDVYMVNRGDEISFDPTQPGQVLKVKSIARLSVVVEVGTVGDIMVVR